MCTPGSHMMKACWRGNDPSVVSMTLRADYWDSNVEAICNLIRALVEVWEPCLAGVG